ncbi:MAG TPA: hypothetical protein VN695_14350 [Streptosporangiaceae bacterium]|nr:hypothetical protein [Streptosporangiaceae bacterium]
MSDQANSEGLIGSAGTSEGDTGASQQGRGHGRRAVMLGAAAVGAGAVAGVAGSAGTAMASSSAPEVKGFVPLSRKIVVRLPPTPLNIDQAIRVMESVLGQAGCQGCFSGLDLVFTYENEFIVNAKGGVQAEI